LLEYFGFSGRSVFFRSVGVVIDKGFFIACAAAGTVLLTLGSAYAGTFDFQAKWNGVSGFLAATKVLLINPITALALGGLLFLLGAVGTYLDQRRQQVRMGELDEELERLDDVKASLDATQEELQEHKSRILQLHTELVQTWLKGACKALDLDSTDRITIYYEHDEAFILLARYSKNPDYSKVHRQKFPLDKGVINQAWQHESYVEQNCPSSDDYEKYVEYLCETYGYEADEINRLTMKSCRYFAKAIVEADVHIGVIVFESTRADFFEADDRVGSLGKYCDNYQSQISKFVRDGIGFDKEIRAAGSYHRKSPEEDVLQILAEKHE